MNSSIYSDLKKFAGEIKGKKVSAEAAEIIDEINDIEEIITTASVTVSAPAPVPELTINDVAAMVKQPMVVLRDDRGVVSDSGTIAVKCSKSHMHKYFIKDIVDSGGNIKCVTCNTGNKFMNLVRETAENSLGVPFVLATNKLSTESNAIEYVNPVVRVTLVCNRLSGADTSTVSDGMLIINIHNTTSVRKIKNSLHEHMNAIIGSFTPELQTKILALKPTPVKKNIPKIFQKEPLPFTQELAKTHAAQAKLNPTAAIMCMNIVSADKLCIENC